MGTLTRFNSCCLAALILLIALPGLGCERSGPELPSDEFPPDPDLPEAVVDLPSPPPESAFEIREFNDDGSLRVEGLIGNRDQYLEEDVEVRGFISRFEGDDCEPGGDEPCPKPHFFIRDHPDDDLEMMVVGYENELIASANLAEDEEFLFGGLYEQTAGGFVSSEMGLLELASVDDEPIVDEN